MENANNSKTELVIVREFDVPREMLWKAWTDPELVKSWWGPKGFTAPVCQIDFKVGGKYLNCMRSPDNMDYWSTGEYHEIVPFEKIVCTDCFSDEKGNIVHATHYGMSPDFPMEMTVVITFEENGGKTKMTLRHIGMPSILMSDDAKKGWNESFDKLDESLK